MNGHVVACMALSVLIGMFVDASCAWPQKKQPRSEQGKDSYRLLQTPDGIHFGMSAAKLAPRAPVAFLFGSLLRESLAEEHCRILQELGFVCVSLDAPGHGSDRVRSEPPELRSWRHRLKGGNDFVTSFNQRLSRVLDHLVSLRVVDPQRVLAVGGSRGGFLAIHFAASDARVGSVAALAPPGWSKQ